MKDNKLLMIVLAFVVGYMVSDIMVGCARIVEGLSKGAPPPPPPPADEDMLTSHIWTDRARSRAIARADAAEAKAALAREVEYLKHQPPSAERDTKLHQTQQLLYAIG